MKDTENMHQKIQDLCACFSGTDPLQEMSGISGDPESADAAHKWMALTALHGINANAEKISIKEDKDGKIKVTAEYRKTELPSPGSTVGSRIFDLFREITHIDDAKGKTSLALGIMDSSIELSVGIKEKDGKRKISIKFPEN